MNPNDVNSSNLSIAPLGAGDLIDRAVRFYRQNFLVFLFIAAPPVIAGTLISVAWTILSRKLFNVGPSADPMANFSYLIFVWIGTLLIWFTETVAMLSVMGGASRNFVRHLLFGEAITFKETYKNTWKRLAGLIAVSSILTVGLWIAAVFIFYIGFLIAGLLIALVWMALQFVMPLAVIFTIIIGVAATVGIVWLEFLLLSRFAYVPQVMLVESQGVFSAIGRSITLASGNVKRFAALIVFSTVATYSALAILYIPLAWYASAQGVEIFSLDKDLVPAWYEVSVQLISQASLILLSPVWMVGLCLLYVDERVRHEGYDIELMAARQLGEIPSVPKSYVNPLQPALADQAVVPAITKSSKGSSPFTTLGLK